MTMKQSGKAEKEKIPDMPCIDCLIFPMCRSRINVSSYYSIFKLLKCELLRDYLIKSKDGALTVACQGNDMSYYEEINIDFDKVEFSTEYFKK